MRNRKDQQGQPNEAQIPAGIVKQLEENQAQIVALINRLDKLVATLGARFGVSFDDAE